MKCFAGRVFAQGDNQQIINAVSHKTLKLANKNITGFEINCDSLYRSREYVKKKKTLKKKLYLSLWSFVVRQ